MVKNDILKFVKFKHKLLLPGINEESVLTPGAAVLKLQRSTAPLPPRAFTGLARYIVEHLTTDFTKWRSKGVGRSRYLGETRFSPSFEMGTFISFSGLGTNCFCWD